MERVRQGKEEGYQDKNGKEKDEKKYNNLLYFYNFDVKRRLIKTVSF